MILYIVLIMCLQIGLVISMYVSVLMGQVTVHVDGILLMLCYCLALQG